MKLGEMMASLMGKEMAKMTVCLTESVMAYYLVAATEATKEN